MSTRAIIFFVYFLIGLLLMIVAMAIRGKERRANHFDAIDGTQFGAGLLILIALLWPLWLLRLFGKSKR